MGAAPATRWRRGAWALLVCAGVVVAADIATVFASYSWSSRWADVTLASGGFEVRISSAIMPDGQVHLWPRAPRVWWWRHEHGNISGWFIWDEYHAPLWWAWVPLVGAGVLAWRRARRLRRGVCARCGYDLRGLAVASPCPECGRGSTAASGH